MPDKKFLTEMISESAQKLVKALAKESPVFISDPYNYSIFMRSLIPALTIEHLLHCNYEITSDLIKAIHRDVFTSLDEADMVVANVDTGETDFSNISDEVLEKVKADKSLPDEITMGASREIYKRSFNKDPETI